MNAIPSPVATKSTFGAIGWLGFFVLCLLGVGLPLLCISWFSAATNYEPGRVFVIELSRLAGRVTFVIGLPALAIAAVGAAILMGAD